jgi:type II secretory pathway pseudopilin PulG
MFIERPSRNRQAYTLVEMLIAMGLFSVSGLALALLLVFVTRSFQGLSNYAVLDQYNRHAMDSLTSEIRQARLFVDCTSNTTTRALSIVNGDGANVTYTFESTRRRLTRTVQGGSTTILLTNCSLLNFNLFLRPPAAGSFDDYSPVDMTQTNWPQTVKIVQLTWKTAMQLFPTPNFNSEDVQTARIIIRKQQVPE